MWRKRSRTNFGWKGRRCRRRQKVEKKMEMPWTRSCSTRRSKRKSGGRTGKNYGSENRSVRMQFIARIKMMCQWWDIDVRETHNEGSFGIEVIILK